MSRRIVITGAGANTPLGVGAGSLPSGWLARRSGVEVGIGACSDFEPTNVRSAREARRRERFAQLAIATALR